jgi:thiamine biosynthesis lipoprotein
MNTMATTPFQRSRLRPALGTLVAIEATAKTQLISDLSVTAGFGAISLVERLMHPTRRGSELATLRDVPLGTAVTVHAWTFALLELCRQFNQLSAGIFDPCLPTSGGRFGDLELRSPGQVILHAPLHLDLGGIAKGFAVDRALDALRSGGCSSGLVNAGGDLAAFGGTEREIHCRRSDGRSVTITFCDGGLATSDTAHESPPVEHQGYYHGAQRDVRPRGYAAVVAPNAVTADALTKCVLAGSPETTKRLLHTFAARQIQFADED